jgi:hypothetical protein
MDITTLEHFTIAMLITFTGWLIGDVYAGAALAIGIFAGREHAQAEFRIIQNRYGSSRDAAPWWCGFDYRAWNLPSIMDMVSAVVGSGLVVVVYYWVRNG